MPEPVALDCARIFRDVVGLTNSTSVASWDDARLLEEPFEVFDIDSLTLLDFVMKLEDAYNIELDEAEVNACQTIGDLAALVAAAKR
jgi:acyl carrier protein